MRSTYNYLSFTAINICIVSFQIFDLLLLVSFVERNVWQWFCGKIEDICSWLFLAKESAVRSCLSSNVGLEIYSGGNTLAGKKKSRNLLASFWSYEHFSKIYKYFFYSSQIILATLALPFPYSILEFAIFFAAVYPLRSQKYNFER